MPVEVLELTMSHVGLGSLSEQSLMTLFGNAHSHALVAGLQLNPDQITNQAGSVLYPAYFMTRLTVPANGLLQRIKVWDTVAVGVEVRRFGATLLESDYVIAKGRSLPENPAEWRSGQFPTMEGNNLIVVDSDQSTQAKRKVATPKSGAIANLPKAARVPPGIALSKEVRAGGLLNIRFPGCTFQSDRPLLYKVLPGRDLAAGHALMFAKFVEIMDLAEHRFLSERFKPYLPADLLNCLAVLGRDIHYFGNCYAGEVLKIDLRGSIEVPHGGEGQGDCDYVAAAFLNVIFEIRQRRNNLLLLVAKVRKVFAVPLHEQDLIADIGCLLARDK